jgi:hypothetical protein
MAWRCVDCDRVWKTEADAAQCCPHVEDIGDSTTTACTACDASGSPNAIEANEECPACHGTGVAYKNILVAVLKQRTE